MGIQRRAARHLGAILATCCAAAAMMVPPALGSAAAASTLLSDPGASASSSPSRGVIVRMRPGGSYLALTTAAARAVALEAPAGVRLAGARAMGIPNTRLMLFSREILQADASAIARSLESRRDVA